MNSTGVPTSIPPTIAAGSTTVSFTAFLHGIGGSGDGSNTANTLSNKLPQRTSREFTIGIEQNGQEITSQTQSLTYDTATGSYKGIFAIGSDLQSGSYDIKLKTQSFLKDSLSGQTITAGVQAAIPAMTLIAGDINDDGVLDVLDYNEIISCFSTQASCDPTKKQQSDLNDDGNVDGVDYNLLLREMSH